MRAEGDEFYLKTEGLSKQSWTEFPCLCLLQESTKARKVSVAVAVAVKAHTSFGYK